MKGILKGYDVSIEPESYRDREEGILFGGPPNQEIELTIVPQHTIMEPRIAPPRGARSRAEFVQSLQEQFKKEPCMENFHTEAVVDHATDTVKLYVRDQDGRYLNPDLERKDKPMGGEKPVYGTMPLEIFNSIQRAETL